MCLEVIFAVGLAGEVVKHMQELNSGDCTREVAGDLVDEVDEAAAKTLEVLRCARDAADALCPLQEEGIEADGGAVGFEAGLIMDVDEVVFEVVDVAVCHSITEAFTQFLTDHSAVEFDGVGLIKLCLKGGKGLVRDVGVAVYLAATGGVLCLDVVVDEAEAVTYLFGG